MKKKTENRKKSRGFKWYLDKILMVPMGIIILLGAITLFAGTDMDDSETVLLGCVVLMLAGLFASPNIVLYAVKDNKDWKNSAFKYKQEKSFEKDIFKEEFFCKLDDPSPYHKKILYAVIREAVLNFAALIILIALCIIGTASAFLYGNGHDSNRGFIYLIAVIVFLIPVFAYNLTCSVYRIRTVLRREYFACCSEVHEVYNHEMLIVGKNKKYRFEYCRCLGIRPKDIFYTRSILIFVPDEVYIIPVEV